MMPEVENWDERVAYLQPDDDLKQWLAKQMNAGRGWLLAHADDGVIWGRWESGELITSHDIASDISPELRLVTLQQAFLFGEQDEVRLWREDESWCARRIDGRSDAGGDKANECFDERQVLWGTEAHYIDRTRKFTHVREKSQQGMDHVVPVVVDSDELRQRKLRLRIRHYFDYDSATGEARIALSRLVGLETGEQESE